MRAVSISLRLTLWFGAIFLLGWIVFGAAMWLNLRHALINDRYQTLSRRLDRLQLLLADTASETESNRAQDFRDFAHATGNGLSEVFLADGARFLPSPSSSARSFPWPAIDLLQQKNFLQVHYSGQKYWVLARRVQLGTQSVLLTAAAPGAGNQDILDRFSSGLLASVPLLLLVSSIGGYWLSRRALGPVDRIIAKAHSISVRNLSERLPVPESGDELARLSETCNQMLERLERAFTQIRQFTADASHELRGPLSFVRTVAEVSLREPGIDASSRQSFADIVAEVEKASQLLEQMLTMARADAVAASVEMRPVWLAALLRNSSVRADAMAAAHHQQCLLELPPEAETICVLADEEMLGRLVWILLDNAIKYTHAEGCIRMILRADSDAAEVVIADTGVGIAESDLPHVFDRFYRADPSRSQVEGSGLGLAIARWIAELHGATLRMESQVGQGTQAILRLPIHAEAGSVK